MGKMTVYHGSNTVVAVPKIIISRNTKDFGPGFYCTIIREQAERWAKRYSHPVVNTYTVRMSPSLIDYIARKTKNKRSDTVDALGRAAIKKIYDLADVCHSDNIETVSEEFIEASGLKEGSFDNVAAAKYAVPSHWDIGKVYKRLILGIAREKNIPVIDALFAACHSFVSDKIDDYNSSFYYDAPQNILNAYLYGEIEDT